MSVDHKEDNTEHVVLDPLRSGLDNHDLVHNQRYPDSGVQPQHRFNEGVVDLVDREQHVDGSSYAQDQVVEVLGTGGDGEDERFKWDQEAERVYGVVGGGGQDTTVQYSTPEMVLGVIHCWLLSNNFALRKRAIETTVE